MASPRSISARALAVLALVLVGAAPAGSPPASSTVPAFFEALAATADTPLRAASVSGVALVHDAGTFTLDDGTVALIDLEGRTVGAVFRGRGSFRLEPRNRVARTQLDLIYGSPDAELPLEGAFFLFGDGPPEALAGLSFGQDADGELRSLVREGVGYLVEEDDGAFDSEIARLLLNGEEGELFHAHMRVSGKEPHFFRFSDLDVEEVRFGRRAKDRDRYEVVTSFNRASEPPEVEATESRQPQVSVMQVEVEAEFNKNSDFSGVTTLYMTTNAPGGSWVPFALHGELDLDALTWSDGTEVEHTRGDESSQIWVRLPESAGPGAFLQMAGRYHGQVGQWRQGWFDLATNSGWYLSTEGTDATFDITIRAPETLEVATIGKRVSREVADGVATSRWVQSRPTEYAGFNVGNFKVWEWDHDFIPPVRVQMNTQAHQGLPLALQMNNPEQFVANDVSTSLSFYQNQIGELDHEEFNVTEIPYLHGQAFPGMVHLSFATFGRMDEDVNNIAFRAHEVAHQWWGVTLKPRTFRDWWLAEGMSTFSSLWYVETVKADPAEALEELRRYRDRIRARRDAAGPIALGYRVTVSGEPDDYHKIVYEKGAWVGHMIRHMLADYETGDETLMRNFLHGLMAKHGGRRISTREFQAVLEEFVQADMGWFFDQWVYGTAMPDYKVARRGESLPDGRYDLELRIRQENVPDDFQMIVPVLLDFGEDRTRVVRVMVAGPETVQEMTLPAEPLNVTVNPYEAVLATVSEESW